MMQAHAAAEHVFWWSLLSIAYTYFGYPLILFVCYGLAQIRRDLRYLMHRVDRRASSPQDEELPAVSLLVAAYNEEEHIAEKLENLRALNYPSGKLQVVIVSDGSTDATNTRLRQINEPWLQVVIQAQRRGKAGALRVAVAHAQHGILVFSDASTLFAPDALRKLVRHFSDPAVGAVCGALRFEASPESQQTEGAYWKYETILRLMEARLGATLTPSGAIYAVRRKAYRPPATDALVDDIITSMNVRRLGYGVHYDPEAMAVDHPPASVAGEFRRRVRIAIGSFRALPTLLTVRLRGFTALAFLSHKLLRWLAPFLTLSLLVSNLLLICRRLYLVFFLLQVGIYAWAALGFIFCKYLRQFRYALMGYFLVAMNLAFLVGFFQCLTGRKEGVWPRVE
jgi:cellulose synthase/poly-beta-1,6-N-acetylglucosamine synthase-like glycosyltransferase